MVLARETRRRFRGAPSSSWAGLSTSLPCFCTWVTRWPQPLSICHSGRINARKTVDPAQEGAVLPRSRPGLGTGTGEPLRHWLVRNGLLPVPRLPPSEQGSGVHFLVKAGVGGPGGGTLSRRSEPVLPPSASRAFSRALPRPTGQTRCRFHSQSWNQSLTRPTGDRGDPTPIKQ